MMNEEHSYISPLYIIHTYIYIYQAEDSVLESVTNPFLYSEFDVSYHSQALGQPRAVVGSDVFSLPAPSPLFSLIPAEYSATMNLKKFSEELDIDLSTVKLREHFVNFHDVLPGSGTLICRTTLREVATSYQHIEAGKALMVVEGEIRIFFFLLFLFIMFQLNSGAQKQICQPWIF